MLRRSSHSAPMDKTMSPVATRRESLARLGRPRAERSSHEDNLGTRAATALEVVEVPWPTSLPTAEASLITGVLLGDARARVALVDRFGPYIERLVAGALGVD